SILKIAKKKKMKLLPLAGVLTVSMLLFGTAGFGQCRAFTKNKCLPQLAPYTSNGQYSGATLFEGETATIIQTFYAEQEYRLLICTQESLGDGVTFAVKNQDGSTIYSSEGKEENYWDFKVEGTQQFAIEISIPSTNVSDIKNEGCVSIMVGFKP
ncbi:MAG: hypothetical protein AAGB22_15060, partial [Bacteroidota bacterium]